jgi:CarD family transcriptional regulator
VPQITHSPRALQTKERSPLDFAVGEKVIYPNHGIGVVESIQTRATPTGKISLYQLRILSNDSRVWIPQQNAGGVGLRHVISQGDARKIFVLLGDGTIDQHPNWKGRFKENSDKMRTGSLHEVAVVLKGLTFLARKKSLSFREKRMLDRAKFLLISEIAEVEGKTQAAVEERVEKALAKTFAPDPAKGSIQKPVGVRVKSDA